MKESLTLTDVLFIERLRSTFSFVIVIVFSTLSPPASAVTVYVPAACGIYVAVKDAVELMNSDLLKADSLPSKSTVISPEYFESVCASTMKDSQTAAVSLFIENSKLIGLSKTVTLFV